LSSRSEDCSPPPSRIRTCSFPASGSSRECTLTDYSAVTLTRRDEPAENPGPVSGPSPSRSGPPRVEGFPPVGSLPSPPSSVLPLDPPPCHSTSGSGLPLPPAPTANHAVDATGLPGFQRVPCLRDVALDPGRATAPRDDGAARVAFDRRHSLGLCDDKNSVAHSHTPQACCVRFGRAVTGRDRNTRYQAVRYSLPGRDLPPLDHAGFGPAHAVFLANRCA
jgi:hypothetical protein